MRDSMWGFLLFAGAAWLAIGWSVLRLEPGDVVSVAGPVVLFGAMCEGVRALAGLKTWWLNAGMAVLFAAIGVVLMADQGSSYATPQALVGWFLMVRGALDVAVSTMNRGVDRTWGVMMALGVAQAGLGFFAAGPLARSADLVVVTLGALGLLRAVADLVTALRLREVAAARHDVLELPPERAAAAASYAAGHADTEAAEMAAAVETGTAETTQTQARHRAEPFHDEVVRATKDLDAHIAQAGVRAPAGASHRVREMLPPVPDTVEQAAEAQPRR